MTDKTVLEGKARDVLGRLGSLSRAELEGLLEAELAGGRRATVINWIVRRNAALAAAERKAVAAADKLARGER